MIGEPRVEGDGKQRRSRVAKISAGGGPGTGAHAQSTESLSAAGASRRPPCGVGRRSSAQTAAPASFTRGDARTVKVVKVVKVNSAEQEPPESWNRRLKSGEHVTGPAGCGNRKLPRSREPSVKTILLTQLLNSAIIRS